MQSDRSSTRSNTEILRKAENVEELRDDLVRWNFDVFQWDDDTLISYTIVMFKDLELTKVKIF
jgi:hypothetical protein